MTSFRQFFLVLGLVALTAVGTSAQGPTGAQVATGTPPFGTFASNSAPDVINLANLNAHIPIPVLHKAGRGTDFTYDLSYDSAVWYPVTSGGIATWTPVNNWGWRAQTEITTGYISYNVWANSEPHCVFFEYMNFVYHDAWGVPHPFTNEIGYAYSGGNQYICGPRYFQGFSAGAGDGSGYSITVPTNTTGAFPGATLYGRDGKVYTVPFNTGSGSGNFTDRNGNEITVSGANFYDTLSSTSPVLTVSGSGTPSSPMKFTYTAPSNGQASYTLNYTNYTVATNFGVSGTNEYKSSAAVPLVTSVVLPDGTQYSIQYEATPSTPSSGACTPYAGTTCVTARIKSMTLPTGGSITYTYTGGHNGVFGDGSTAGLTRVLSDGANWAATWNYSRLASGTASETTVTAPDSNPSILQFQGIYETQSDVYDLHQGSAPTISSLPIAESTLQTSGLLQEVQTCYNTGTTLCTGTAVAMPISKQTVTTILPGTTSLESQVISSYNSYGQLSEEDDYGYGAGAPGSLLRKKLITIQTVGTYQAIQTAKIQDGSGNLWAETTMTFDEPPSPVATSGTPQHQNPTVGRGNPTTIHYYINSSTSLIKKLTYFDTGNVQNITDVNNATTTYTYADVNSTCGNAFPTGVTEAISTLTHTLVWKCTGGVAASVKDENLNSVSTSYTDTEFWRPASTTDQLNNSTTFTYSGQTQVESAMNFNGTISTTDTLVTLDGLGRSHITQTKQGQSSTSYDSVETDYDVVGRPSRVTQPYSGTVGQTCTGTCPATTTAYDALSRPTLVTDAGSGTASYTYPQNDVYQTLGPAPNGESTKRRQLEYDALGRLTSVCEVTAGTTAWPGGTCAQTSAQTGYWTKYTYDANGNLTGVTQNAQGSAQQTRTYVYDDLSRMTSETNPESGTTTYVYDTSSTCNGGSTFYGDLTEKHDAAGNFTCFWYDSLHRLLTEWVNSGPAQWGISGCKRFFYDNTNGTLGSKPSGVSVSNVLGRLTEAETDTCAWPVTQSSLLTDEWFNYTVRGETTDLWASTPHSGGYNHTQASYWANGATNTVQMIGGDGYGNAYNLDGEGRVYSTSSTVTGTSYNNASQPTQVNYGSGDSDSFTYTNTGQMSKYTYNVNGQSVVGTLTWNPLGTLGSLVITDPYNSSNAQTCNYAHDDLIRIASASCTSTPAWSQTFTYDAFGNINKAGNSSFGATYSPTTNRMTTIGTQTPTYDADGNVTNDFLHSYSWDAYGRPITVADNVGNSVSVTYDALGRMVEQNRSGAYTEIEYSPSGFKMQLITNGAYTAFVPLPGGAEAVWPGGPPYYRHPDWQGSSRFASTTSRTMLYDGAYAPFGEQYANSGTSDLSFTGMDQQTSSNLYDFPAREYGIQGRWPSPDPAGLFAVDPSNPQSWNRYAYVLNNPLAMTDPTGMCGWWAWLTDNDGPDGDNDCDDGAGKNAPPPPQAGYGAGFDPFTGVCVQVTLGGVPTPGTGGCSLFSASGGNAGGSWWDNFSIGGNNPSWAWTFTKSFFTFSGGPNNTPTCAGQTLSYIWDELTGVDYNGEAAATSLKAASTYQAAKAIQYAASRPNSLGGIGLICPTCSSVFNSIMGKTKLLGEASEAVPLIQTSYAAGSSIPQVSSQARNGTCAAAFPMF
jgi:RHS repeat-associated protein